MKKLICVLLALVLALAPVSAFAEEYYTGYRSDRNTFDKDEVASPRQGIYVDDWYDYDMPYIIKVDRTNQLISIYEESSPGYYDVLTKRYICSTGTKKDPTPKGMFTLSDASRKEWRYFKTYKTYVRYGVHIEGNYFFHSLLYSKPDTSTMSKTSYKKLGSPASHGCIRMLDDDIKWMFEKCLAGTRVYVMDCEKDEELHDKYMPEPLN